ncbi:coiled-coil domain-containing protein 27 isoform X1 [Strix uralensis]|uniref:coiled-coil domain-containing protein 27 isoform X1 n=1 Tax=Strix uralensis TaxID=36305 RepID=UPI003DA7778D
MAAARPGPPHPEAEVAAPPPLPGNRARSGPGEKRRLRGPALGEPPPVPGEPPPALGKPLASPERAPLPAGGQTAVPGSGEGPGSAGEGLQPQLRAHLSPHQESSPRSAMEGASSGQAAPDHGVSGAGRASRGEAKLTEAQGADPELRQELQKARDDYSMATGVISSLQRQLEIQESQLRRAKSEKEMLQKKLREQENQLQALSAKFCSLREGRKHEEMMATIEENCSLRQVVTEQESKLAEQNKLISELEGTVRQLQAEVLRGRYHIHEQQRAQEARQSQAEMLQHRELQARVALERISSRVSTTSCLPLGRHFNHSSRESESLETFLGKAQQEMLQDTTGLCSQDPASLGSHGASRAETQAIGFPALMSLAKQRGLKYQKPLRNSEQFHHQISNTLPGSK